MQLGMLNKVIVQVNDMQAMVEFYRDKLGLALGWPGDKADYSQDFWVELRSGTCGLALHGGGREPKVNGEIRFGFAIDDCTVAREELLARGVKCGEVRSPAPGTLVVDFWDIEGNQLFLQSHTPTEIC
jgi:catechol 2,3-dioxygenase-like lactoylglutathione lyase family enzyme